MYLTEGFGLKLLLQTFFWLMPESKINIQKFNSTYYGL